MSDPDFQPIPQHTVDKASAAFRQLWKWLREISLWSGAIILISGMGIVFLKAVQQMARGWHELAQGNDPDRKPERKPADDRDVAPPN